MNHPEGHPIPDSDSAAPRLFIETYGCQMNLADSLLMAGILNAAGYRRVDAPHQADVILLNTCAVRQHAENRVLSRLDQLKPLKRSHPKLVLAVCGCMAQHLKERLLARAPWIDLLVGPDGYRHLPALIDQAIAGAPVLQLGRDRHETYDQTAPLLADGCSGWLPVQRGCNRFCTFCVVPYVRGRERSSSPRQVLKEARALAEQGAREITLLGQTVNSYAYQGVSLADLLEALSQIETVWRLRFTSPYPLDFTDRLIETIATNPKVMPHLHLPLQSGSDPVLVRMNRGYRVDQYLGLVERLRQAVPRLALSTDLIVGFPGETDQDFQRTLDLVAQLRFDSAFMFAYSHRPGTVASRRLPDDVPLPVKKDRLQRLIDLQEAISRKVNQAYLDKRVRVLVSGRSRRDPSHWVGKTETFKTTVFSDPQETPRIGDLVTIQVQHCTSHTLIGQAHREKQGERG
ncbi:MAG: tRNA (N6-isopentenyl adenosine(37)-C2)-methylthiotransferase MiaB [Bradymonadales bacterium]|nr:tRNA (N6-isopentenyl adenosine(37)-C2)-methylthiotransferase MiaB [Bradymonadales bacterium]